jgi:hypothetical protein
VTAVKVELSQPQLQFVGAPEPFPCICGGFGSGKTHAGVVRGIVLKLRHLDANYAQYLPTYDLVRHISLPRYEQVFDDLKVRVQVNRSEATIRVMGRGKVIFRTMDDPERIIGYEVADSGADELDTLKTPHAKDVWRRIISRNRQRKPAGEPNTASVTTTPEGFRFVYEAWGKNPLPGYRLIRAPTASNARNLPPGYIDSLRAIYPANALQAYLEGRFVNLTSGTVYSEFDRVLNASRETIRPNEPLHVGMDFNVGKMAATIHVMRDGDPHAVAEHVGVLDTPAMTYLLDSRYKSKGHPVIVYPDASGNARKSQNASESDLAILRSKFSVFVNPANPLVKDRVLATNAMFHAGGRRRYKVNVDACPHLTEAFEQQCYDKNGEPDKSTGLDHVIDADTYFIAYKFPVVKPVAVVTQLRM